MGLLWFQIHFLKTHDISESSNKSGKYCQISAVTEQIHNFSLSVIQWKRVLILEAENSFNMVIEAFILPLWAMVFLSDETVLSALFLFLFYFKIFCFSLLVLFLFVTFTSYAVFHPFPFLLLKHWGREELTLILSCTAGWG